MESWPKIHLRDWLSRQLIEQKLNAKLNEHVFIATLSISNNQLKVKR